MHIYRNLSHFVTGNLSLGLTITMLILPSVVSLVIPTGTSDEWRNMFLFIVIVLVSSSKIFLNFT